MKNENVRELVTNVADIDLVHALLAFFEEIDREEQKRVLHILKQNQYHLLICRLLVNDVVRQMRSWEERFELIKKLKECSYHEFAYEIVEDMDVLTSRNIGEQLSLMDKLKDCAYDEFAYQIVIDTEVLANRNTEEQLRLMDKLKSCHYAIDIYTIAVDTNVLIHKNIEEQLRLMDEIYQRKRREEGTNLGSKVSLNGITDLEDTKSSIVETKIHTADIELEDTIPTYKKKKITKI